MLYRFCFPVHRCRCRFLWSIFLIKNKRFYDFWDRFLNLEWTYGYFKKEYFVLDICKNSVWKLFVSYFCWQYEKGLRFAWKITDASKGRPRVVFTLCPRVKKWRKSTQAWTVHNTALNSSMGIDIPTYRIPIGRFGPGRGYISTGIAEIYSSSITVSDIHYRMIASMVLLTFLLKCCVMI